MAGSTLQSNLEEWSRDIGLALSGNQIEKMARLNDLVVEWSTAVRLTGYRGAQERRERYFGEALHAAPAFPENGTALDIGTGGGTPALPLAIARPAIQWILLEPNKRKAVFLEEAKAVLGLSNIEVRRERYEAYEGPRSVALITSRGVAVDERLLTRAWYRLESGGCLYLWTGKDLVDEIPARCRQSWTVRRKALLAPRRETWLLVLGRLEAALE